MWRAIHQPAQREDWGLAEAEEGVGGFDFRGGVAADALGEDGAVDAEVGHGADELVDGDFRAADFGEEGVGDVEDGAWGGVVTFGTLARKRARSHSKERVSVFGGGRGRRQGRCRGLRRRAHFAGDVVGVPVVEGGDVGEGAVPDGALDEDERDGPGGERREGQGDAPRLRATKVWPASQPRSEADDVGGVADVAAELVDDEADAEPARAWSGRSGGWRRRRRRRGGGT